MVFYEALDPLFEVLALVNFHVRDDDEGLLILDELLSHSGQMCPGIPPREIVERDGGWVRLDFGVEIITLLEVFFENAEIEAVLLG